MLDKLDTRRARARPLPRRGRAMTRRLRLAIPNKGRLVEPTLRLLHDAGLVFEEHDRSLVARVQNYDLDILFVRTNDVIEFVGDGVADLGITGIDLLTRDRRRAAADPVARLRPLPARRRRPERHAVPDRRGPGRPARRDRPPEHGAPLLRGRGHRRSTSSRSRARSRSRRGSVWPRRIVDLVSTGSTLVDERPAPDRRRPRRPRRSSSPTRPPTASAPRTLAAIDTMLSAVIAARGRKYLMMNAPATRLPRARGAPARARIADGHPARARRA